jgi:hypothetical protein
MTNLPIWMMQITRNRLTENAFMESNIGWMNFARNAKHTVVVVNIERAKATLLALVALDSFILDGSQS